MDLRVLPQDKTFAYVKTAILLAGLNSLLFAVTGRPLGLTTALSTAGSIIYGVMGGHPEGWEFFRLTGAWPSWPGLINYPGTWMVFGVFLGAWFNALGSGRWRFSLPKGKLRVFAGGILMGFGARLAGGCNVGALWGGIASSSLHGWIFGLFLVLGAVLGLKLLERLLA